MIYTATAHSAVFEGHRIDTTVRNGEPWWVLSEVCKVLEIGNSRMASRRLDPDEKGVSTTDTLGGAQRRTIVNESGLYRLILMSRKPAAKRFTKWVVSVVLPAIRQTGRHAEPGGQPEMPEIDVDPFAAVEGPAALKTLELPPFKAVDPFQASSRDPAAVARHYAWDLIAKSYSREYAKLVAFMELVWETQPNADAAAIAHFATAHPYVLDHPALYAHASLKLHRLK